MKRRLRNGLITGWILYIVLGFVIVATVVSWGFAKCAEQEEAQDLYKVSLAITSNYASEYFQSHTTLQDLEKQLKVLERYTNAEIWVVNKQGDVLVGNIAGEDPRIEGFSISDFGSKYSMTGNFYHCFDEKMLTVFAPITVEYSVRGYVMIHKKLSVIYQGSEQFLNLSYVALLGLLLVGLVFTGFYIGYVYLKIWRMNLMAHKYMDGDYTAIMRDEGEDELGFVAASFNYMANELNTLEDDQRKFISNISHDFRSPLTSIKGYIEAMLDGTIPVELQEKYLKIIITETERLTKLTSGLIELNQYGGHGKTILDKTDFDINEVIGQTAATFEGACNAKHIVLELVLTGDELFVHADKSKIQQIVYNLTDNAIKFSHNDSSIRIETHVKNEKVFVSVKDSGIGIPKEAIGKIWERFYKTDLSRGKDKKGTGIGLAIVKEIIQAHGENINVISTEGVGTEFIFTLPFVDDSE